MACHALIVSDMRTANPNLKFEWQIQRGGKGTTSVLYNKVARQHCVWVIWHSFRFAHKHVNTFHVFFLLPASFYDKQNACKSRILQTINALRQAAALRCLEQVPLHSTLCSAVAQFMPLAVLRVRLSVCVWQRQILLMPKCVCARILCSFFFLLQQIRFLCTNQTENIRQMEKKERRKAGRKDWMKERKQKAGRHTVQYAKL